MVTVGVRVTAVPGRSTSMLPAAFSFTPTFGALRDSFTVMFAVFAAVTPPPQTA